MACTNGSQKKSSAPNSAWLSTSYGQDDIVSQIANRLWIQPSFFLDNIPAFCSVEPPPVEDFSSSDFLNPAVFLAKMINNAKALAWYDFCECVNEPSGGCTIDYNAIQRNPTTEIEETYTGTISLSGVDSNDVIGLYVKESIGNYKGAQHSFYGLTVNGVPLPNSGSSSFDENVWQDGTVTLGGFTCPGTPPPAPPAVPPNTPIPPEPMTCLDEADKQDLLDAINDCKCETKLDAILAAIALLGAAIAGAFVLILKAIGLAKAADVAQTTLELKELVEDIVIRPENSSDKLVNKVLDAIEDAVPVFLLVRVNILEYPGNYELVPGQLQRPVIKLGWISFLLDDEPSERQFISFEKQAFLSPFPGEDISYEVTYLEGVTGQEETEFIYLDRRGQQEDA